MQAKNSGKQQPVFAKLRFCNVISVIREIAYNQLIFFGIFEGES